jgi:outer membrane receptor protein involved in Fe transport
VSVGVSAAPRRFRRHAAAAALALSCVGAALAQAEAPDEVRVTGHYENAVGTSDAASQGAVGAKALEARPLQRPADVLEAVPGVITTQHSGEGKANQYFLRGFNLDHGTDFATTVAHMPVNMPTHAHGQGYTDLNFLIPELVSRISYKKGPYFADEGDFATAGAANINYQTRLRQGVATLGLGDHGWRRALAANSSDSGPGHLLYAAELFHNDGPWDHPSDYNKLNGVLSYSIGTNADGYTLTGMGYNGTWNATDQIPKRAVESGALSRFGAVDPSDGGRSSRYSLSLDRHRSWSNGDFHMSAYFIKYRLQLWSNFTFFLNDHVNGDQFEQLDERKVLGLDPTWTYTSKWGERQVANRFGADLRRDAIGKVALYDTVERRRVSTVREDKVGQTGAGLFYENSVQWSEWLRTTAGVRTDWYRARVDSSLDANSGSSSDHVTSPKLGFVLGPFEHTEYFLNFGQGFHSNDARGTTISVDPKTAQPAEKVKPLVKARGEELGVRTEVFPGMQSSLALWRLRLDSELVFVGDAGTTEATRPSLRRGVEWSNRYAPRPWMIVDFDASASRARFRDGDPVGSYIPGAIDKVASLGVTLTDIGRWSFTGRVRYFGPRPLVENDTVRSRSSTLASLRTTYRLQRRLRFTLDVLNLFDRKTSDIEYFYESRLRSEPAPVSDVHFHPAEPRTFRAALVGEF